jgi:diguanylate cyclase (GGDEF)-like protein/PAS domain S-box-containing protein
LADRSEATAAAQTNASRTAAFWHALVQYPTASFWVEARGRVIAGQPPAGERGHSILVHDTRIAFTVHAALPEADALAGWERAMWQSVAALAAVTLAFLFLTRFLSKALRQRAAAERSAAASTERATQLAQYRAELQETVAHRTEELAQSNSHLETELTERKAVQAALREHDALLNAVTKSAAELLGSQSYEDAIATVLALIGTTIAVSRVQSTEIAADGNGHFRSSVRHEWSAPGIRPTIGDPLYQGVDLTPFPALVERLAGGGLAPFYIDEIPQPYRSLCERAGIQSILHIPILVANAFWGSLNFIDSSKARREWSWAETDTLKTLAGLVGMAITRARYVEELADADTIVQNSPTILYRLRGEPAFPLMYISNNIAKFGHDPASLMRSPQWAQSLIDPLDLPAFSAAMARMLQRGAEGDSVEFRLRTGSGEERWVENRYSPRRDQDGRLLEVEGIIIDVTDRKAAEEKIALLARTDSLTGLANRATFLERLRQAFAATARGARGFAVLYLDLDYFKPVNDTLGHAAGDRLLCEVAARLVKSARDTDLVARLGGDEFAVLQADFDEPESAGMLAARIVRSVALPYLLDGTDVRISASIGICPHSESSSGPDEMLAQADLALYRAKEQGRNQYRFYSENLDHQVLGRVQLAEDLRRALEGTELELYCEPQVELITGKTAGAKALVRWHHPTRGLLKPDDFIPILEKTATGIALGHWLLERACRELSGRRAAGAVLPVVAVDIRFSQLKNGDELVRDVDDTLASFGLLPSDLELDVTEETLAQATLTQNDSLTRLHELGVKIAIADFGTKCSSFEYLRAYAVSRIELSQSLISGAFAQPARAAALRAVVALAEETGIGIITQGLETPDERAMLFSTRVKTPHAREVATSKRPA